MEVCFMCCSRWFFLLAGLLLVPAQAARAGERLSLFNGKDLDGWVAEGASELTQDGARGQVWTVKDGNILCTGQGFGFLRYNKREFADFTLHVEFRLTPKCNTGVGIRTRSFDPKQSRATRPSFYSYEIQLIDEPGKPPSKLSSGSLYRYVAPSTSAMKPAGEWNVLEATCIGPKIEVTLNDTKVIEVDQRTIDTLKAKPLKGSVCLQNHGGTVEFRNVYVEEIDSARTESNEQAAGGNNFSIEPGFKSLFNGKDLSGWRLGKEVLGGKTETADGRFAVKDGILVITGAGPGQPRMTEIDTTAEFDRDFVLRLEFRASRDANSGIHLRDHEFKHQLQVRDYLRVGPYKDLKQYKPGDWNAIEVTVKADPASEGAVALCTCNGEVLEKALSIPAKGTIALQSETNVVEYRRIRIKEQSGAP
jgi:hypothetical protein